MTIAGKQICDWMYVIGGSVYGGFTVDLLRSRMGKGERKQHDQAWGFDFGDVGVVNLVPPSMLGRLRRRREVCCRCSVGAKSEPQDYAVVAATEHPMSVNMRESLEQTLTETPGFLQDTDDHGFTFLHQLALAGSLDGVDVCLKARCRSEEGCVERDDAVLRWRRAWVGRRLWRDCRRRVGGSV